MAQLIYDGGPSPRSPLGIAEEGAEFGDIAAEGGEVLVGSPGAGQRLHARARRRASFPVLAVSGEAEPLRRRDRALR